MFHGAVIYFFGEHTTTLCFLDMHYGNVMFSGDGDYITMVTIFLYNFLIAVVIPTWVYEIYIS